MADNNNHFDLDGAFRRGAYDLIIQAIENGNVDVNDKCKYYGTDLMYYILYIASHSNKIDLVKYLISKGAMINQLSGPLQWTALHAAAYKNNVDIVTFLLDSGVDSEIKDVEGHTAADLAKQGKWLMLAEYIESYEFELVKGVQCECD